MIRGALCLAWAVGPVCAFFSPSMTVGTTSTKATGSDYLPAEALARAKEGNKFEKVKLAKCGSTAFNDVYDFAAAVRSGKYTWEELDIDDADIRVKWVGLFHRRKRAPGTWMVRLKLPNGIVTSEQLRYIADCAGKYDPSVGVLDITTRQSLQIRGVPMEDAGDVISGLQRVGASSLMSGLDNLRNVVGSPLAGIDPFEIVDTRALCKELDTWYTGGGRGNLEWCNLPRKINVAASGSPDDLSHTMINDVGLQAAVRNGKVGYSVVVGGYFSIKRYAESVPLGLWVAEEQALALCQAVVRVFRDQGARGDRQKTRLMWLVEACGVDQFRADLIAEMSRANPSCKPDLITTATDNSDHSSASAAPKVQKRNLLGVHPQRQEGLSWVGVCVPAGRLLPQEAKMAADVADRYSGGEVRLTVDQNVLFSNVRNELVEEMQTMPFFAKFPVRRSDLTSNMVSCTGSQFCGLGLAETKNKAIEAMQLLDAELTFPRGAPTVHWTGCPNSCGQAQVGDIGLMGAPAKKDGKATEGFNLFLKAQPSGAEDPAAHSHGLAEIVQKGVPAGLDDLLPALRKLCVDNFGAVPKK